MKSNYKPIGDFIRLVDIRNKELKDVTLVGVSINKRFIPSVANIIGSDMTNYKIIKKNQFACSLMQVRRDGKIPVALFEDDEAIISQAYPVFEIVDKNELLPQYLMMWMTRSEFDREACFYAVGGVRGSLEWEDFCAMQLPVPTINKQKEIVKEYHTIVDRIKLNEELNQKLEDTAQEIFDSTFNNENNEMEQVKLGDFIEIKGGFSYHSDELFKGSAYLLGMGCISFTSRFLENGMRLYSNDYPEKHEVKSKDIVIATRQQSENMPILGYPAMIPPYLEKESLIVASNLYKVENNSNLSNEIIYQLLRSTNYLEHIKLNTKGTTVGMITKDAVEDFYFNLPSLELISKLHIKLKYIVDLIFIKRNEIKKLIELKEILLSKMATIEE
ncbi:restriction endonuclease subunit S [Aliarcobacter butzleri]|uniref:restriction endonuclease subunit S n=1 Tax=Aliarcobacter butzleri TaxID=28197 RepID=UPI00263F5326|nr:restriction endonuclease subunit S [Aliarcobacter butzleri]MDN5060914.1 restriction endonuclease subunit S [Aliarcobacter butzleri]